VICSTKIKLLYENYYYSRRILGVYYNVRMLVTCISKSLSSIVKFKDLNVKIYRTIILNVLLYEYETLLLVYNRVMNIWN
jgi:hypothetical protein